MYHPLHYPPPGGSYTFMCHYLPSYGFALTLASGLAAWLERHFPRTTMAYIGLALALFFAPSGPSFRSARQWQTIA